MTSGSGDSRMLGGGPLFGESAKAAASRSTVTPETSRLPSDSRPGGSGTAGGGSPPPSTAGGSTTVVPETGSSRRPMTVGTAPMTRKKGRRARLTIKRIDPWSTLKFSFVYGLAGMVVLLVAVVALYGIVDAMGVIGSIQTFLRDVEGSKNGSGVAD